MLNCQCTNDIWTCVFVLKISHEILFYFSFFTRLDRGILKWYRDKDSSSLHVIHVFFRRIPLNRKQIRELLPFFPNKSHLLSFKLKPSTLSIDIKYLGLRLD